MSTASAEKPVTAAKIKLQAVCLCGHEPCDGLDCGPYLPGQQPRKKKASKPAEVETEIRKRAWETRRAKYGSAGHR